MKEGLASSFGKIDDRRETSSMTTFSIIVYDDVSSPPDVNREDIINIEAPWDLVEGVARLALARYPDATRVEAVDENGHARGQWTTKSWSSEPE